MAITPNSKPPEIPTKTIRLTDFSMGLNSTISGSLLSDKELQVAKNISLEQKGTIMPGKGRRKRYDEPFSANPCCGIGSYYKNDGISRLLIASHDTLYTDKPSISAKWDTQVEWGKEGTSLSSLGTVSEVDGSFTKLGSLMGLNGNCVDADYLLTTGCTAVTDGEVFKFAPKALKATLTTTQGTLSKLRGDLPVRSDTYYALSAYVRNGNLTTGLSLATLDYAGAVIKQSSVIKPSAWEKVTLKLTSTDMANATSIAVVIKGTSGQYGYIDGIVLVPITVLDYAGSTYVAPDLTEIEPSAVTYAVNAKAKWDAGTLDGVASTDDDTLILGVAGVGIDAALEDDWETGAVFTDVEVSSSGSLSLETEEGDALLIVEDTQAEFEAGTLTNTEYASRLKLKYTPGDLIYGTDFTGGKTYSADSEASAYVGSDKAFDDNESSAWWSTNTSYPHWVKVDLGWVAGITKVARKLRIYDSTLDDFKLQGSNNDSTWADIYTDSFGSVSGWEEYEFENATAYRYYRIYAINGGAGALKISEIELIEATETPGTYTLSGTWEKEYSLSTVGVARGSMLSWSATTPNDTSVQVQAAIATDGVNYGSYANCTSGSAIPGITAGDDLSSAKMKVKVTLTTTDDSVTPSLNSLTLYLHPDYKTAGSWVSPPLHVESRPLTVGALALGTVLPSASTEASVEYAVSVDGITWSDWVALSSTVLPSGVEEYLKIRILLTTSDTSATPEITSCEVTYPTILSASGEWLSEVLDLTAIDDDCTSLVTSVVDVIPAGTGVTLYCRSRMDAQAPWGAWTEQNTGVAIASLGGLIQFKYVLTTSTTATPSVTSLAVSVIPTQGRALWVSEIVDVSQALDKDSGKGVINSELVGGKIAIYSRSYSALDASPSMWYGMLEDGTLVHPENNYVQIALEIIGVKPIINDFTLSFDGAPTATTLLTGLATGAEYSFTTLKDVLIIANGKDTPMSWDGTGVPVPLTGSPPTLDHVLTHNNRVWGTDSENKSRVRFSNILDPSTWDILNFIDFNPEDGDYITALKRSGEDLVVAKQRSMALLTGNSTYNYSVVWLDTEQGATGKRATCNANKYFVYVSQDGIRFTDFNTSVIASERLLPLWAGVNKRRLSQAAAVFWRNMILIALPNGNSLYNNVVLCYDFLRNAWFVREGWNVNDWAVFQQYGEDVLLATDSLTGQVYQVMLEEAYDDTAPVVYDVRIKDLTFDAPERYKLFRTINLDLESSLIDTSLEVDLIVDGVIVGTYSTTVPTTEKTVLVSTPIYDGEDNIIGYEDVSMLVPAKNKVQRMILPPLYNAVLGRSLSLAMRGRCGIQGIAIEFSYGGVVPDGGDTV